MAELPSFSPPASEGKIEYRTYFCPPTGQYDRGQTSKLVPDTYTGCCDYQSVVITVLCDPSVITKSSVL